MAFKMRVVEDTIELQGLLKTSEEVGEKIIRKTSKVVKARVEVNLRQIQKVWHNKDGTEKKRPREVHFADDVKCVIGKDQHGYRYAKIQGGKHTGTLWHIVNDGTYRTKATHFMDSAISDMDIEKIIDEELRKVFG